MAEAGLTDDSGARGPFGSAPPAKVDCWNQIGVFGDQSCPELSSFTHCRNCHVFAAAARTFFQRPAPPGYLAEWSQWLGAASEADACAGEQEDREDLLAHGAGIGVLIFRLGTEWLAFRTRSVAEVTTLRPVHRIPHRFNHVCAGLVNLHGQLQLCVSLHGLLGVELPASASRLVVIHDGSLGETWAFAADEVLGVRHVHPSQRRGVPATLANPAVGFSQAILTWNGQAIGLLDEERIFSALRSFVA
jgi:chemotaxis-related protein WspD